MTTNDIEAHDTSASTDMDCTIDLEHVPVDCLLDDHPASDNYLIQIERLKRAIVRHSDTLRPNQVRACKLRHQGYSNVAIAEKLNKKPNAISALLSNPKCKQLLTLLGYLALALEGPREGQRRAMLWRIAVANEEDDPRCAISALAELNRMHVHRENLNAAMTAGVGANRIEIIVTSPALARTTLDD